MVGANGLLLHSSVRFIGGLLGCLNSKQALNDGTISSREVMELSIGKKRLVASWTLAIMVAASFLIRRLGIEISKAQRYVCRSTYSLIITPFVPGKVILFINSPRGVESAPSFHLKNLNANVPN